MIMISMYHEKGRKSTWLNQNVVYESKARQIKVMHHYQVIYVYICWQTWNIKKQSPLWQTYSR